MFDILQKDPHSNARTGVLNTPHGEIPTPIFMPVGTVGSVKGVYHRDLINEVKAKIILGNTYHLYLRPGTDLLHEVGGLHKFMNWENPILTDSGGYQVFSLADNRKITEEGAKFASHIDGSKHMFSPERSMEIQRFIGADIIMAFDECPPYPSTYQYAKDSMNLTHRWLDRCINYLTENEPKYGYNQMLFPIVQGSTFEDLRKASSEFVAEKNCEGNAIGGLSVGEPAEDMYKHTELVCNILPKEKPRYLMGVGTPWNILECIALGVDMFDCVMPTRNGRNGQIFTWDGVINIRNKKWERDFSEIDATSNSFADKTYSKAYLRHLFAAGEMLGPMIASLHNLSFYLQLVEKACEKIISGEFASWKTEMVKKLSTKL